MCKLVLVYYILGTKKSAARIKRTGFLARGCGTNHTNLMARLHATADPCMRRRWHASDNMIYRREVKGSV